MYWDCICDCGEKTTVSRNNLILGAISSCGKCIISKGEEQIKKILDDNNIPYVQQKTFNDCLSNKNTKMRFDFFVNNSYIVEYDGKQHYEVAGGSYFTEEMVNEIKMRDKLKNKWCFEHNIPIKRIPYTVKNITLNDIISNTYLYEKVDE